METFFKNLTPEPGTADRLLDDLQGLPEDAEELYRASGGRLAEATKHRLLMSVERVREGCRAAKDRGVAGVRSADRAIHQHPYPVLGVAFGLGLLIGVLARRK